MFFFCYVLFVFFFSVCGDTEFTCNDGLCIEDAFVCDSHVDCTNGEDESDCVVIEPVSSFFFIQPHTKKSSQKREGGKRY